MDMTRHGGRDVPRIQAYWRGWCAFARACARCLRVCLRAYMHATILHACVRTMHFVVCDACYGMLYRGMSDVP